MTQNAVVQLQFQPNTGQTGQKPNTQGWSSRRTGEGRIGPRPGHSKKGTTGWHREATKRWDRKKNNKGTCGRGSGWPRSVFEPRRSAARRPNPSPAIQQRTASDQRRRQQQSSANAARREQHAGRASFRWASRRAGGKSKPRQKRAFLANCSLGARVAHVWNSS